MPKQIHGHDVLQIVLDSPSPLARETLREAMSDRFGPDARYHTCSAEGMDAEQLLDLLIKRKRQLEVDRGFTTDAGRICRH